MMIKKILKKSFTIATGLLTLFFTFVPESSFGKINILPNHYEWNIIIARLISFMAIYILSFACYIFYLYIRKSVIIKGKSYCIEVEYGDLLDMDNCKRVIPFDECFTTTVGDLPEEVNCNSICGQYLIKNPIQNMQMQQLINDANLKPAKGKSKCKGQIRYDSGKLVPNGNDLLMSFAKLDENGLGTLTYKEFLDSLFVLWKEIDKYYGQVDVCIPILGSGVTRMDNYEQLTQQELLDIIIKSYKLSANKIKSPCKLHIVCKERDDFSLNKIGEL